MTADTQAWDESIARLRDVLAAGTQDATHGLHVWVALDASHTLKVEGGRPPMPLPAATARAGAILIRELGPRPGTDILGEILVALTQAATLGGLAEALSPGVLLKVKDALAAALKAAEASGVQVPTLKDILGSVAQEGVRRMTYSWLKGFQKAGLAILGALIAALGASVSIPDVAAAFHQIPIVGDVLLAAFVGGMGMLINFLKLKLTGGTPAK